MFGRVGVQTVRSSHRGDSNRHSSALHAVPHVFLNEGSKSRFDEVQRLRVVRHTLAMDSAGSPPEEPTSSTTGLSYNPSRKVVRQKH